MTLHSAIDRNEFVLHYQPQVEVLTGKVVSMEALVRWDHPRAGLLLPGSFIPDAEAAGLIGPLTVHLLDLALEQLVEWDTHGWTARVAVNLSAGDLGDPRFVVGVIDALNRHQVDPTRLELEVTESAALADIDEAARVLGELDRLGVDIAIDDFGAGYSSLAYLKRLPVRRLKLDRSLITDLAEETTGQVIVRSTLQLARELGLGVVAEGVEDDDTLLLLRTLRCDTAQGFGLCRPLPAADVRAACTALEDRLAAVLSA